MRRKIFVSSRLRGPDWVRNMERAAKYGNAILNIGDVPVVPHVFFTPMIDMENNTEVELSFWAGMALLEDCDVFEQYRLEGDTVSEGMEWEITWWNKYRQDKPLTIYTVRWIGDGYQILHKEEVR